MPRKRKPIRLDTEGAAAIDVTLAAGILTVKHGDTKETLIERPVFKGFWCLELWPLLSGKGGRT